MMAAAMEDAAVACSSVRGIADVIAIHEMMTMMPMAAVVVVVVVDASVTSRNGSEQQDEQRRRSHARTPRVGRR